MFNNTFSTRLNSSGSFGKRGIRYWLSLHLKDNIPVLLIGCLAAARFQPSYFDDEYEGTLSRAGAECLGGCAPSRAPGLRSALLCSPGPTTTPSSKVGMLFFTQCFGAVLDLIHLRFQQYKAKRVFSAAGQLVCVVNPTHNLKVSGRALYPSHRPPPRFGSGWLLPLRGRGWWGGSILILPSSRCQGRAR